MFCFVHVFVFFFKQKTAYEMRISDWSSDVCSSDLMLALGVEATVIEGGNVVAEALAVRRDQVIERGDHASSGIAGDVDLASTVEARRDQEQIGRASCRERVCQYGKIQGVAVLLKKKTT